LNKKVRKNQGAARQFAVMRLGFFVFHVFSFPAPVHPTGRTIAHPHPRSPTRANLFLFRLAAV